MASGSFPEVTLAGWRALVEKDLAGKPFDKTLVHEALPGVAIAPLYTEAPPLDPAARFERQEPFRICMRHEAGAKVSELVLDVEGGADALWLPLTVASTDAIGRKELAQTTFIVEPTDVPSPELVTGIATILSGTSHLAVATDPLAWRAHGRLPFASLRQDLDALGALALGLRDQAHRSPVVMVSTEPYHEAGADAADEIAIALSTGVTYLETLLDAGLTADEAADVIALRITVGRDTFVELCKLRALRICWTKLLLAIGATAGRRGPLVHAVCSTQTLTVRDPWVNMLRVTTQVFAAVIGGADLVTPNAFDRSFGTVSDLGRRVARNTGLVLREESALGKVSDPAGGSYYFDSLTDTLARQSWSRFQDLARDGGIVPALESGQLAKRLEGAWKQRLDRIAKRKAPILGVSEFANLGETLPHPVPAIDASPSVAGTLPVHRDAAAFEELRARADSLSPAPEVILLTLGSFAESRPRAGFAATFFAAGGFKTREQSDAPRSAPVVCLCGTDARYAEEAASRATALKQAGVRCVLLAGRPGELETKLREAGVDGFIFAGCDVVTTLTDVFPMFTKQNETAT